LPKIKHFGPLQIFGLATPLALGFVFVSVFVRNQKRQTVLEKCDVCLLIT